MTQTHVIQLIDCFYISFSTDFSFVLVKKKKTQEKINHWPSNGWSKKNDKFDWVINWYKGEEVIIGHTQATVCCFFLVVVTMASVLKKQYRFVCVGLSHGASKKNTRKI